MRAIRTGRLPLLAAGFALVVNMAGCGLKGDLYLPDQEVPGADTAGEAAATGEPVTDNTDAAPSDSDSAAEAGDDAENNTNKNKTTDNLQSGESATQP